MSRPFTSPTPWLHRNTGGTETVVDRTGQLVCILGRGFEAGNGALIVAAPLLAEELRSMLIALPNHSLDCKGRSVAGAACCFFAERHRNARKALAKSEQDGGAPEDGPVETGTGV